MPKERFLGLKISQRKWLLYALLLTLSYILQSSEIMPAFYMARPTLVINTAIAIAMLEGEIGGGIIGAAAGVFIDISLQALPGFYSIILLICCSAIGLVVRYLMRNNLVTALLLGAAVIFLSKSLFWFFFYCFSGESQSTYIYVSRVLPECFYTLVCQIPLYYAARSIKTRYERIAD